MYDAAGWEWLSEVRIGLAAWLSKTDVRLDAGIRDNRSWVFRGVCCGFSGLVYVVTGE
jgi:hypothetical protein